MHTCARNAARAITNVHSQVHGAEREEERAITHTRSDAGAGTYLGFADAASMLPVLSGPFTASEL